MSLVEVMEWKCRGGPAWLCYSWGPEGLGWPPRFLCHVPCTSHLFLLH